MNQKPNITEERAQMPAIEFTGRFVNFLEGILAKSVAITESATVHIAEVMDNLLKDSERIAHLSEESIRAVKTLRDELLEIAKQPTTGEPPKGTRINHIISALKELSEKDQTVSEHIEPIITALQYQDRITQNFNNLAHFVRIWGNGLVANTEEEVLNLFDPQTGSFDPLGQLLCDKTTMEAERDILRNHFSNLAEQNEIEANDDLGISFF